MSYIDSLFNMRGKVVVVTGATGQLGAVICKACKEAGCTVIGTDLDVGRNKIDGVAYHQLDITKAEDVVHTFSNIVHEYDRFDILINNAGVSTFEPFENRPEEKFDWVMDVNLKGTFFCIQAYANLHKKHELQSGSIVNIGSVFGVVSPDFRNYTDCARRNSEVYGATKAGVIQMTRYFAVHLAERNIRVNSVSPGGIFNPAEPQGDDFIGNYSYRVPMKRMANDHEMIGAILYFAGEGSSYTTGQDMVVDGGMTSW